MEESIIIDENSEFGKKFFSAIISGNINKEKLEDLIIEEKSRNIDLKTFPIDRYIEQIKSQIPTERNAAISSLRAFVASGNKDAFNVLCEYFKDLPAPTTLEEVHFKIDLLRQMQNQDFKPLLIPILIDELYDTPSNNTTRQWISAIFKSLENFPCKDVRDPLLKMLKDKRFSYRMKKKMKDILSRREVVL